MVWGCLVSVGTVGTPDSGISATVGASEVTRRYGPHAGRYTGNGACRHAELLRRIKPQRQLEPRLCRRNHSRYRAAGEENIAARRIRKTRNLGVGGSLEKAAGLRLNTVARGYPELKEHCDEEAGHVWRRREHFSADRGARGTRAE